MNKRVPLLLILGTLAAAVAYTAVTTDKPKEFWAGLFLDGVTSGSLFALIALGYTMVYGVLRMINFAHGEVFMIGSFAGWVVLKDVFGGDGMADALIVPAIAGAM